MSKISDPEFKTEPLERDVYESYFKIKGSEKVDEIGMH